MKVLAIDIGAGTEDILLYDDERNIENCVKMVLPSPSGVFAKRVREITRRGKDVFIKGDIIGGGAFTVALKEHLERGLRVLMTEKAAYTVRNDLEEVKELGINIVADEAEAKNFKGETLEIHEVNLDLLKPFLEQFNLAMTNIDVVAVAVQDHGTFPKGTSNRKFRVQKMREIIEKDSRPESLAFWKGEILQCFLRMQSAGEACARQLANANFLAMDTSPAAILGCLKDPVVEEANPILAVNVGNGHTMAAIIVDWKIVGLLEHHTRLLNSRKIGKLLKRFADGKLGDEEVFNDNGHGVFYLEKPPGFSEIQIFSATGPNRSLLRDAGFPVHFAAPAGDVMMTGPVGLVEAVRRKKRGRL